MYSIKSMSESKYMSEDLSDDEILRELEDDVIQSVQTDDQITVKTTVSKKKRNRKYRFNSLDQQNPFLSESKLDLDDEYDNGFRIIETSVLINLLQKDLTVNELKIFLYIFHKTRGFSNEKNKFCNWHTYIPVTDIVSDLSIARTTVSRTLKTLREKQMIYTFEHTKYKTKLTGLNYRYDTWK